MKTALIAGATGLVGKECMYKLLENEQYSKVYVLVRKELVIKHPKLVQIIFDYSDFSPLVGLETINDVFCCLGTTMKTAGSKDAFYKVDHTYIVQLAQYFSEKNSTNFLLISALGADTRSSIYYSRVKGETETAVLNTAYKGIFIFRPSFLVGDRKEFRLGETIGVWLATVITFPFFGSLKKYQPIHASTIAIGMISRALSGNEGHFEIESDKI